MYFFNMDISSDARITELPKCGNKFVIKYLKGIENDLDTYEKVSLLFLISVERKEAFNNIVNVLNSCKVSSSENMYQYVLKCINNCNDKLLEALCLIQNKEILRKLGFTKLECEYMTKKYSNDISTISDKINVIGKCLYFLCESLEEDKTKQMLHIVYKDLEKDDFFIKYFESSEYVQYLEMHMLYWIQKGFIIVKDNEYNLNNLLKVLKKIDFIDNPLYIDLSYLNQKTNVKESNPELAVTNEGVSFTKDDINKKYLCIIVNEVEYNGEHDTRDGSNIDRDALKETFLGCNFTVQTYENLMQDDFMNVIKNIGSISHNVYNCVVLCILSHGYNGGIITCDGKKIHFTEIEECICCIELEHVKKVIIAQCCQGTCLGSISSSLTFDGGSNKETRELSRFKHFILWKSTMDGFASIRDKKNGSWFIQELCAIIRKGKFNSILKCAIEVNKSLEKKRGIINGVRVGQLPVLITRIYDDFVFPSYTENKNETLGSNSLNDTEV